MHSLIYEEKINQIQELEELISAEPCPNLQEHLTAIKRVIIDEDGGDVKKIDEFAAEQIPSTIVEKLCDLVIGQSPHLELALSLLSILCKYGTPSATPPIF